MKIRKFVKGRRYLSFNALLQDLLSPTKECPKYIFYRDKAYHFMVLENWSLKQLLVGYQNNNFKRAKINPEWKGKRK